VILHFTLTPEEMQTPSVERAFFVSAGIGYIRVASFEEKTTEQLRAAIEKLGGDRLSGLVLDLRGNPGGLVTAAVSMASLFLQPGTKIVTVRGRHVEEKSEVVPATATPYGFKLAILVNEKTASASEIVSGALQDHDRAIILGVPSFGKGLVQSVFPLTEGAGLALTTALYYTPSGRSIQKPLDPTRFELAATTAHPNQQSEFRTDKGRKVTGGGGIQPDVIVYPEPMNRLRAVLDASASFTNFATEYLRDHKVTSDFEATPEVLDQFRAFLSARQIRPGVAEWLPERDFVSNRLKTEIFNQAFGVEKGDEVEAQRDPVILKAIESIG
jgi:carboxyl-terminal processing protease